MPNKNIFIQIFQTAIGITYKNEEVIEHSLVTITINPHQITPYGF
jgi:hypothetical protein